MVLISASYNIIFNSAHSAHISYYHTPLLLNISIIAIDIIKLIVPHFQPHGAFQAFLFFFSCIFSGSNVNIPGLWMFQIGNVGTEGNILSADANTGKGMSNKI